MLNPERIRMMTALAVFAKNGGAEELRTAQHYRYDYVMTQLFSAFVRYSLCFVLCSSLYLLLNSNDFFGSINTRGFLLTVRDIGLYYLAGLALYLIIAIIYYIRKHMKACRSTQLYASGLKRLERRFDAKRNYFL